MVRFPAPGNSGEPRAEGARVLASENAVHGCGCVEGLEADEGTVWFILQSYHPDIMVQMGTNPAENQV